MSVDTANNSKGKYRIYFLISLIVTLFMLFFVNQWFWVGLPFVLTAYVYMLDVV